MHENTPFNHHVKPPHKHCMLSYLCTSLHCVLVLDAQLPQVVRNGVARLTYMHIRVQVTPTLPQDTVAPLLLACAILVKDQL